MLEGVQQYAEAEREIVRFAYRVVLLPGVLDATQHFLAQALFTFRHRVEQRRDAAHDVIAIPAGRPQQCKYTFKAQRHGVLANCPSQQRQIVGTMLLDDVGVREVGFRECCVAPRVEQQH